jgi:hypothetical protein
MKRALASLALLCAAPLAQAQGAWRDAVRADVERDANDTYNMQFRAEDETGALLLSARGDFDGDGEADIVRWRVNERAGEAALVVTDSAGEHVVGTIELAALGRYGVAALEPQTFNSVWEERPLVLTHHGFLFIYFEAHTSVFYRCDRTTPVAPNQGARSPGPATGRYCSYTTSD